MSENISDTPNVTESWCPDCRPDRDPLKELLIETRCGLHRLGTDGYDDHRAGYGAPAMGTGESEGLVNAAFADLLGRCDGCGCDPRVKCLRCSRGECRHCASSR